MMHNEITSCYMCGRGIVGSGFALNVAARLAMRAFLDPIRTMTAGWLRRSLRAGASLSAAKLEAPITHLFWRLLQVARGGPGGVQKWRMGHRSKSHFSFNIAPRFQWPATALLRTEHRRQVPNALPGSACRRSSSLVPFFVLLSSEKNLGASPAAPANKPRVNRG